MADLITIARANQSPVLALVDPALVATLITAASQAIENYLRRQVIIASKVVFYDGDGSREMMLDEPDLVTLTEVIFRDINDVEYTIPAVDFHQHEPTSEIWFVAQPTNALGFRSFPLGKKNIKVTGTFGLTTNVATVPAIIQQATVETVLQMYDSSINSGGLTQEKLGDYSYVRMQAARATDLLPMSTKRGLNYYMNRVVH